MSKKLTKEELDAYLGEEAEEFYDELEAYNKTTPRGRTRSINKKFLRSPIKYSVKYHIAGHLGVLSNCPNGLLK